MEFSDRITKVIEFSELSPAEFAEEIGVQRSSISHIISGRNKPSLDFITKLKSYYQQFKTKWAKVLAARKKTQTDKDDQ